MSNNNLKFTDATLVVEPLGLDKIWSFKGSIEVPWEHVRGATHDGLSDKMCAFLDMDSRSCLGLRRDSAR